MDQRRIHYGFAALSFLVALLTYGFTMQPSIPFWDCGEFAAASIGLGVPHPPGAPLWTIIGRLGMLIPIFTDPVARYNFLSVLSSALSIMLLYLTIVRLIKIWRGTPRTMADMIIHYGGAFVGAMAYTFTDSFWFNALECEVYAFGSLFISLVPWLILVWYDHADEPHSEKYLLLIAYVIGLSLGVHQLALLTIFPVWMLVYYKRWKKTTVGGWLIMVATSILAFAFTFLIVLSDLVDWAGHGKGIISVIILAGMLGGIVWSQMNKKAFLNLALWSSMLIFLGYTTYAVLMVRAVQDPPMNQHHPSNFKELSDFINRTQYGDFHWSDEFEHRRLESQNGDHSHDATFNNYSSDWDFFWRYQTGHMFTRYLGWNFVGRASDEQDAGVDFSKTWALPFALGIFGLFWHFRRDPKRALTLVGAFIIMGFVTAWYQNQQDPQPRERDYFYVGAFYVYAMWIGIGATGILEYIRGIIYNRTRQGEIVGGDGPVRKGVRRAAIIGADVVGGTALAAAVSASDGFGLFGEVPIVKGEAKTAPLFAVFALLLILGPLNQCLGLAGMATGQTFKQASKWGEYSRYHNNVPFEYAYNFLQSCSPNAILFTAGDNDTFPLWCLQDVYGIRRDIRIVNLSLGNMSWYITQLKHNTPWGVGKPINLPAFTDELMSNADESQIGLHATGGPAQIVTMNVKAETMAKFTGKAEPGVMTWKYSGELPTEGGYVFTIADQLVKDIVMSNLDDRPIYFAALVPSSYMAGLEGHLSYEGMAARVTPLDLKGNSRALDVPMNEALYRESAMHTPKEPMLTPDRGMILNSFSDPQSNRSAMDDRYAQSYYYMYFRLANYYLKQNRLADAKMTLDTLERRIPSEHMEPQYRFSDLYAELYEAVGDTAKARKYSQLAIDDMKASGADTTSEGQENKATSMFHLAEFYLKTGQLDSARKLYTSLSSMVGGNDKRVMDFKLLEIDAKLLEKRGDKRAAYAKYDEIVQQFGNVSASGFGQEFPQLLMRHDALKKELGIVDSTKPGSAAPVLTVPVNPPAGTKPPVGNQKRP